MKLNQKNIFILLFFLIISSFGLCIINNNQNVNEKISIDEAFKLPETETLEQKSSHFDWLIMIYLDGDNNLEENAIDDLNEIEEGIDVGSTIGVVVLFDRILGEDSSNGDWTGTRLYNVTADSDINTINSILLEDWGEKNMGDSSTLELFLNYCFDNYTADNYWLNIWDHGGGINGLCEDITNDDFLTLDEMQQAIDSSTSTYTQEFDLISIDACYMSMIEVAYELKEYTDYFIGSEESIPVDGFDYISILEELELNPSMNETTLAEIIINSYEAFYDPMFSDVTLSCLNLSIFDQLIPSVNSFSTELESAIIGGHGSCIEDVFNKTLRFMYDYCVDFINFIEKLLVNTTLMTLYPNLQSSAQDLLTNFASMVLFNYQGSYYTDDANGVAVFFPYMDWFSKNNIENYISCSGDFNNIDWLEDTLWNVFIDVFYSNFFGLSLVFEELVLGNISETNSITSYEVHLYKFNVKEEGIYDIKCNIIDGDADIYLLNSNFQVIAYSKLYNLVDGPNERIRGYFTPGIYIIEVHGWMFSSYNVIVNQYSLPILNPGHSMTVTSGTEQGDKFGHYAQVVFHYFEVSIIEVGNYTFSLSYESSQMNFDLFLLNANYHLQFSSESIDSLDEITVSFNELTTVIICVYGLTGNGSFTIEVVNLTRTSANGLGFLFSFLSFFGLALTLSFIFYFKRLRK